MRLRLDSDKMKHGQENGIPLRENDLKQYIPRNAEAYGKETLEPMNGNDQKIIQAFQEITAQADAYCVERKVREHQMKKNPFNIRRPVRTTAVLAAVLALIMVPVAAFGIVYGYRAFHIDNGYRVSVSGETTPIKLEAQKMEELEAYILRFENGAAVDIREFGKIFENYDALDAWFDGMLLTSPRLHGESILYCLDDGEGTPVSVHISGSHTVTDSGKTCAVAITVPLVDVGEDFGWATKNTDMLSSRIITTENGMTAEFVTTETSVTAFWAYNGILYRLSIAGNHEEAAAVLAEIINTMK